MMVLNGTTVINGNKIMIIKYRKDKVYNPKEFRHNVRRATYMNVNRRFVYVPLRSQAVRFLLNVPIVGLVLRFCLPMSIKALTHFERKQLTQRREELT